MSDNFVKGYAVIKGQWVSNNILDEYLPFIATIILDEGMDVVDENLICSKLNDKYHVNFQPTFVRQVISNAMVKNAVESVHGNFVPNKSVLKRYYISDEDFEKNWAALSKGFRDYASQHGYEIDLKSFESEVHHFLESYDDHVIFDHIGDINTTQSEFLYQWCNYLLFIASTNNELYSFVIGLCTGNLVKTALFYSGKEHTKYVDLEVFLDTPMIFALLGMDTPERREAFKYIVDKAKSHGMTLHVFDHNIEEVLGIMERASSWLDRSDYDNAKANRAAQFFCDAGMSLSDRIEFIGNVENELNLLGITRATTNYIEDENAFQADEKTLLDAIKDEYGRRSLKYCNEEIYESSISVDVRSIVMIQRKRQGSFATVLESAKAIFITTNSAIAKVSKDYMQKERLSESKIPACITADIFGTLLWLDFPDCENSYPSMKLLADCKALLRPSPQMIAMFKLKLDEAYKKHAEGLTEEKFLFLRSHPIVQSKLLDATSGDYAQFTDQTWREVYNQIESHAMYEGERKYDSERQEHEKTKRQLDQMKNEWTAQIAENQKLTGQIEAQKERFAAIIANCIVLVTLGLPYLVLTIAIILIQNQYATPTRRGVIIICLTLVMSFLSKKIYKKFTAYIKEKVISKL